MTVVIQAEVHDSIGDEAMADLIKNLKPLSKHYTTQITFYTGTRVVVHPEENNKKTK